MIKKILMPLDQSSESKNAVKYAARKSSIVNKLNFVLLHVEPMVSSYMKEEARKNAKVRKELDNTLKKNHKKAIQILEQHKEEMVRMGINPDSIEIVSLRRKLGMAKDIIDFAQENSLDAILVGRRGKSKLQELFVGSTTANLIDYSRVVPVWVVDGKVSSDRILLAVDGSEQSLKALDHVIYLTGDNPNTYLTLYHIKTRGPDYDLVSYDEEKSDKLEQVIEHEDDVFIGEYHEKGVQMLQDAGIGPDRYEIRIAERRRNVGNAILQKAERDDFGTIVIGRSGVGSSYFMGSVSRYVVSRAENRAVWLVS